MRSIMVVAAVAALGMASNVGAQTITNGFTFAVASSNNNCTSGSHFHSNTGGSFGNPAGKAEVGNYSSECVRGLSEYSLAGLLNSPSAFVTFNVSKLGGLFDGINDTPLPAGSSINIFAYLGNNTEDVADWQAPSTGSVGSFGVNGLFVGQTLSFDITSIFNAAVGNGNSSLGIKLVRNGESSTNTSQADVFDNFHLTSDNQSTTVTPEPSTYALMAAGLAALGLARRRRRIA